MYYTFIQEAKYICEVAVSQSIYYGNGSGRDCKAVSAYQHIAGR